MFEIDSDMTIYITRGDVAFFSVTAEDNGERYKFQPGDVVRIKVTQKKNCENVAFQKDFPVLEETETVEILLTEEETKIGDVISKPVDYWYEVELNPYTNPQTIIGYDDDGPKIFKLFPEGRDLGPDTELEDVPVVDSELSLTSDRPVQNQAVARAMSDLFGIVKKVSEDGSSTVAAMTKKVDNAVNKASKDTERLDTEIAVERARINNLVANTGEQTEGNAELIDIRVGADGKTYPTAGEAVREQVKTMTEIISEIDDALFIKEDNGTLLTDITGSVLELNTNAHASNPSEGITIESMTGYTTVYFVADKEYSIYTKEIDRAYYAITIGRNYTGIAEHGSYNVLLCSDAVRYRNSENNLPTESNKLLVNEGDVVAFTVTDGGLNPAKIYGYASERKVIEKKSMVTKSQNQIDITTDAAHYVFKRVTNTSINIDTWRLYQGDLVSGETVFNMWTDSDAEGVVKIYGEDDYLGGYHGDEIMTGISVFIDGEEVNMETDFSDRSFNNITIYVDSVLYHCNTSELADAVAFDKHKMLVFEGNKVRIGNWFKARENLTMYGAPTALFQCHYKDSNGSEVATHYSVDSDYKCYKFSEAASVHPGINKNMKEAQIQTKYGFINFKLLKSSAQSYLGNVAHTFITSQNRIKIYFYAIGDGEQYELEKGEVISSEFEFEITK